MALHNELGRKGEELAGSYLQNLGFQLLFRNWRHRRFEIDIIAEKKGILHFIEVKTRRSVNFGLPEEAVTKKKLRSMIKAASCFLRFHPHWKRIQFNILSISITQEQVDYFFIEDVYL